MKKTTLTILTVATAMTVFACAKKDHKSPLEEANTKIDSPASQDAHKSLAATVLGPQQKPTMANQAADAGIPEGSTRPSQTPKEIEYALTETFQGSVLTLAFPNVANWGMIQLDDEDAKAMFNALRVKAAPTAKNDRYAAGVTKTGRNIRCYKGSENATPTKEEYSCSLFMDYKAGSLNSLSFKIDLDAAVPKTTQKYFGNLLELTPNARGAIHFSGVDARALFVALAAPSVSFDDELTTKNVLAKSGKSISCSKSKPIGSEKDVYECSMVIDSETGTVLDIPKEESPFAIQ